MPIGTPLGKTNRATYAGFHENHSIHNFQFLETARLVWVGMPKVIMPPTDCCPDRPMEADSMMSVRPRPPLSH